MRYLIAGFLGWVAWRALWAWVYHSHRCGWCDGGRVYEDKRRLNWRWCRHCGGSGTRRRAGRWFIDKARGKR